MHLIILLILIPSLQIASAKDSETALLEKLFKDYGEYERRVRPKQAKGDLVEVHLGMELYQVIEVNELAESLKLSVWVHMEWQDSRLSWDLSQYAGVRKINVKPDEVWTPDIVLFNSVDNDKLHMNKMETDIRVDHKGKLWWSSPMVVETRCQIDVEDFPFDKQHCYLKFSSWTHSLDRMNVTGEDIDLRYFSPNQEWKLSGTETINKIVAYPDSTYSDVNFHFVLERRSMFYTINLIFPIVLITVLAMLTFILPSDSGERMGVSVTLMLTVTVFMLLITEMIPESSLHIAIVEVFFVFCLILIILVIVAAVFISRIYNRTTIDPPMGPWTRKYIFGKLSYMVYARHDRKGKKHTRSIEGRGTILGNGMNSLETDIDKETSGTTNADLQISGMNEGKLKDVKLEEDGQTYTMEEEWAIVGKTCDHCLFVIFFIAFIIGIIGCFVEAKYVR